MKIDLRKFRNDRGISQIQMGSILGSKQPNISAIENEGKALTPDQYRILVSKYGEEEVLKYKMQENSSEALSAGVTVAREAWELIQSQIKIIQSQQETIKAQQQTISFFTKKDGAGNAPDANAG